jgi:hypothetical protein
LTEQLTKRWTQLRYHPEQTEIEGKRRLVIDALSETEVPDARFIAAAPTVAQAKEIFWSDLLALTPSWAVAKVNRTELSISLINSARLMVCGLDRPQRIEGVPIRRITVDEIANCPSDAWAAHIRPALSDPNCLGSASLIGVPEGRNFFYKMVKAAEACSTGEWDHFTWLSADIVPAAEIAAARASLDPMTYAQEYEGSFITFEGRAYYGFGRENVRELEYDRGLDLVFCFDFNVKPGVAVVLQEQALGTCVIGEVWIERDSNTPAVCKRLGRDWGKAGKKHEGRVKCYGDPTGGLRGTAKVDGTDWELIRSHLSREFPGSVEISGEAYPRVMIDVESHAGPERVRVNALNGRIQAADGSRHLFVDARKAPHMVEDFEGTRLKPDGSGELDKKDKMATHMTDAVSYYAKSKFPLEGSGVIEVRQLY